jgi:hypothetical protein
LLCDKEIWINIFSQLEFEGKLLKSDRCLVFGLVGNECLSFEDWLSIDDELLELSLDYVSELGAHLEELLFSDLIRE